MSNPPRTTYTGSSRRLPEPRQPAVIRQPHTYSGILSGAQIVTDAIKPTLGPLPRHVALEGQRRTDAPEFLDDGATIARRIIEILPRSSDVGAMLLRQALWKMHNEAGDGTVTMALLYRSILAEGIRYVIQYDADAMLLRRGLEKGLACLVDYIQRVAHPLRDTELITSIALGMCHGDKAMAGYIGEIFDMVGPDGLIMVEGWNKAGLEREYIEGTYWKLSGWFSRLFVNEKPDQRVVFEDAALLVSDLAFREPAILIPVLEKCIKAGVKRLFITAREISDAVIGLLAQNNQANSIQTCVVRLPRVGEFERVGSMEDIATLTGGRAFYSAAYADFSPFQSADLGYARRAWATESLFGIYGGKGQPRLVRQHIAELKGQLRMAENNRDKADLQARLGRLHGGTVILRVGGIHEAEREARKAVAERTVTGLRNAIYGGVVDGGGVALIKAQSAFSHAPAVNLEETLADRILNRALEEPLRAIASNAGFSPDVIVERVRTAQHGFGFDARSGQMVCLRDEGILDAAMVLQKALEIAVHTAAMALTTDIIIHHSEPAESLEP